MKFRDYIIGWGTQAFIATDQWVNAVLTPVFGGGVAWADETLSARTYRMASEGRWVARMAQPAINLLFLWQKQDPGVNAAAGKQVTDHCERAFWKEKLRRGSPPEER